MSIQSEQTNIKTSSEEQPAVGKRAMSLSLLRSLPGLALVGLAGVLYSRASYGPFGDPAQRAKPCTVSHCAHNATLVLVLGIVALLLPRVPGQEQEGQV